MANSALRIQELKEAFRKDATIRLDDLLKFYRYFQPDISINTIRVRIKRLAEKNIISRVGRGTYMLGQPHVFTPPADDTLKQLTTKLKTTYPYLKICLWRTSWIAPFMLHQPGIHYTLVEVESDSDQRNLYSETVFHYLQELFPHVFHQPDANMLEQYASFHTNSIIVLPLISEAPLLAYYSAHSITLEKMLVDIFSNPVLFAAQQGSEKDFIFTEVFEQYAINRNSLFRYANRRNKEQAFKTYLQYLNITENRRTL